jgi:N-methylhydantoinase A
LNGAAPAVTGWNMHHRYLIGVPMVQVETLGAGGGSICRVNNGEVEVGPRSAGADPGPICYGRGGTEPTVTDALLMLGILCADSEFAGGSFKLTEEGVREAFQKMADQMGYGVEQVALDCWRVVNANMSLGVRRITAGKGIDPKDLVMLAYGGNGPAFAAIQAAELGITKILVPKASPTFSALGTLVANPTIDEERACIAPADRIDPSRLKQLWTELGERAEQFFKAANFSPAQVAARYQLNMRYPGQNWVLTFEVKKTQGLHDLSFVTDAIGRQAIESFNKRHMEEYGHIREEETPEITGARLTTYVETPSPIVAKGSKARRAAATVAKSRRANLGQGYQDTNVYRGSNLKSGHEVIGPAIIEETFTTIVVYPGWKAQVDAAGDYEMTRVDQ